MNKILTIFTVLIIAASAFAQEPKISDSDEKEIKEMVALYTEYLQGAHFDSMAVLMNDQAIGDLKDIMAEAMSFVDDSAMFTQLSTVFDSEITSADDLRTLDNKQFFVKFMNFLISLSPMIKDMFVNSQYEYIGIVRESEQRAYVVARMTMPMQGESVEVVDVIPLLKEPEGKWKIGFKGDFTQMIKSMFKS